jgi:hypothetical protein
VESSRTKGYAQATPESMQLCCCRPACAQIDVMAIQCSARDMLVRSHPAAGALVGSCSTAKFLHRLQYCPCSCAVTGQMCAWMTTALNTPRLTHTHTPTHHPKPNLHPSDRHAPSPVWLPPPLLTSRDSHGATQMQGHWWSHAAWGTQLLTFTTV